MQHSIIGRFLSIIGSPLQDQQEIASTDDLSSISSDTDTNSDDSSDVAAPLFSLITSESEFSDRSSPESEPDEVSSFGDELGMTIILYLLLPECVTPM